MRLQDSEADIAVDLPTDDSKNNSDIEKVFQNNFEATYAVNQYKILVCNFCEQIFENQVKLQDHTKIIHKTGRDIRIKRTYPQILSFSGVFLLETNTVLISRLVNIKASLF